MFVGSKVRCTICKKTEILVLNKRTSWIVDFDNYGDFLEITLCPTCKELDVKCFDCEESIKPSDFDSDFYGVLGDWFYDYFFYDKDKYDEHFLDKPAHLCPKCKDLNSKTNIEIKDVTLEKCERCYKLGEESNGKWNTNEGHVYCHYCGSVFCYRCHGLIHYNK